MDDIKSRIENEITMFAGIKYPALLYRFVLKHGHVMNSQPYLGKRMKVKECFKNATHLMMKKPTLRYAEGLAISDGIPLLMQHGWCVDEHDNVFDPTWSNPAKCQYYGIAFDRKTVNECMGRNRYYGIMSGETVNLEWMNEYDPKFLSEAPFCDSIRERFSGAREQHVPSHETYANGK